jgi:hypothetical protein
MRAFETKKGGFKANNEVEDKTKKVAGISCNFSKTDIFT